MAAHPQTKAQKLAEGERLFQLTFDQAPIGAALSGPDFRFRRVNARFAQMTGYSRDELLQLGFRDITHPDDLAADVAQVERLAAGEISEYAREKRYVRKDGSIAWGQIVARVVTGDDGRPLAYVAMVADVTERRLAEEALREREERLRTVLVAAHEGVALQARDGRVLIWNEAAAQVFGVPESEIVGESALKKDWSAVHEDGSPWPASEHPSMMSFATGESQSDVTMGVRRGGELRWINVNAEPIFHPDEAEPHSVVVTFTDITERKAAENEIRHLNLELREQVASRTEHLDAASRELEALAYSISHDVRAPLRVIDGFSAMVLEDERDSLSPEATDRLHRVRVAAQTMGRLIDDLLGLSNVSRRDLVRQTVDVSDLAGKVGEEMAAEAPLRDVELTIRPSLTAQADPTLVRLILRELLGNAWKFTAPRKHAHVEVGALDSEGDLAFYVRDDGVGFDMSYAEHLFGIFQRMHEPGRFEGDGVGLATVQRLVRRHGGRVWAEAEVDEGATFFFTLPEPPAFG